MTVEKNLLAKINDGGSREEFSTGAKREKQIGKGRYDLITPIGLMRLANWYELGALKYADRNWENGLPISNCLNSLFRHAVKYMAGYNHEDHLAAIVWNAFAIMHFEATMPELMDLPTRKYFFKEFIKLNNDTVTIPKEEYEQLKKRC